MPKRITYSKPLKYYWHHLYGTQKKYTPEFTNDQIFHLLKQSILTAPNGESIEARGMRATGLEMWRQDYRGELLHIFFLDRFLRDFLEGTPISDIEGIKKFLHENGLSKEFEYFGISGKGQFIIYSFGIHLPFESDGYAFSLSFDENGSVELFFCHGLLTGRVSDKFYADLIKKTDQNSVAMSKMFRLGINTLAYMNCFPDCVADGVPQNLLERDEDKSARNFTLQLTDKVKDIEKPSVSRIPHFRKGHFRVLRSDYFKNKKGEIVFVSGTMVNGKAKTVSISDQLREFSNETKRD